MMQKFIFKIKTYLDRKRAFKKATFVLENGKYKINSNAFSLTKSGKYRVKIRSKNKYDILIKEGNYIVTPYKFLFLNKDIVFSFVRGRQRYEIIKKNFDLYSSNLMFKTMDCSFVEEKNLIVSNCVKGDQYSDDYHMFVLIDFYVKSINKKYLESFLINMSGENIEILFYPQHGDCHAKNIFWNDTEPTLIDLDDIDKYPLFYDIFYYVIASKHEEAFALFKTKMFQDKLFNFCITNNIKCSEDIVDLYLSAYIYFWINKMHKNMKYHDIHFYMRWFESGDLSLYPNVSRALKEYYNNLKTMRIKNDEH